MNKAAPPCCTTRLATAATACSRAGEVSTISPSRSNASPPAATVTLRSTPSTNWRTGSASRNSLATSNIGALGRSSIVSCQCASATARFCASRRTGLVSTRCTSPPKPARAHHAQRVRCQRSAARSKLDINGVARRTGACPAIGQRRADHLAEHLADLRRSGEIAVDAERVARRVIISVARFHIRFDNDRPLGLDAIAERALERGHETLAVPAVASTRTRRLFAVSIR